MTDFGPNFDQNIGSIAVFGKNSDPAQSIIFAGTGFGQERTTNNTGNPNVDLNTGTGGQHHPVDGRRQDLAGGP